MSHPATANLSEVANSLLFEVLEFGLQAISKLVFIQTFRYEFSLLI